MQESQSQSPVWHGTTILTVRKGGKVVIGGDGQVSICLLYTSPSPRD